MPGMYFILKYFYEIYIIQTILEMKNIFYKFKTAEIILNY